MLYSTSIGAADHPDDNNCDFFDEEETDLLNISAHSSGDHRSSATSSSSSRATSPAAGDTARPGKQLSVEEDDSDVGILDDDDLETDDEKLERLLNEAQSLHQRFRLYCQRNDERVPGLSKLRTRFEKEVEAATLELVQKQQQQQQGSSSSSPSASTPAAVTHNNRPTYLKCNCLSLLELTLHVLENEPDVVSVMHPVHPRILGAGAMKPPSRALPTAPFEVDIITCGGLRWFKIKGTSRRNLELELSSCADRRPFVSVLENLIKGCMCTRLPFGSTPQLIVLFYYRPSQTMIDECKSTVADIVRFVRSQWIIQADSVAAGAGVVVGSNSSSEVSSSPPPLPLPLQSGLDLDVKYAVFENAVLSHLLRTKNNNGVTANGDEGGKTTPISWKDIPLSKRFGFVPNFWSSFLPPLEIPIALINFDVTALVALCSDTCNGHADCSIPKHPILDEQCRNERTDRAVLDYMEPCLVKHTKVLGTVKNVQNFVSALVIDHQKKAKQGQAAAGGSNPTASPLVSVPRGFPLNEEMCAKLYYQKQQQDETVGAAVSLDEDSVDAWTHYSSTDAGREVDNSLLVASSTLNVRDAEDQENKRNNTRDAGRLNWIVSDVALSEFEWIMGTIAGPSEFRRAIKLLRQLHVVSCDVLSQLLVIEASSVAAGCSSRQLSAREALVMRLDCTGKISDRHKAVFGVGDALKAITLSANKQFVQAAKDQGVDVCVCFHPSRALTERKRLGTDRIDGPRKPPRVTNSLTL